MGVWSGGRISSESIMTGTLNAISIDRWIQRISPNTQTHGRHYRRSGHKALTVDGQEVHRAQNAVDAGEIIAFEVCML